MKKTKIVEMYYVENRDRKENPYFTWLEIVLDDGRILQQVSTDSLMPFKDVTPN